MILNAYYVSQNRMNKIIEIIFKKIFKKTANCARFYEINRKIFLKRLHEKSSRFTRIIFNKRFIDIEKYFLMIYIRYYDKKNLSIISKLLIEAANFLIHARNFSTKSIEDFWFKCFLKRHFKMKKRRTRFISTKRKDVYEFKKLKMYFK